VRKVIDSAVDGYISPGEIRQLLDACGIPRAGEEVVATAEDAVKAASRLGYPVVMKVIGPVHKSDVGGVVLNVKDDIQAQKEFLRMMQISGTTGILIQPMLKGTELFIGANHHPTFGHMILCGLGGIFIEVMKDISSGLVPVGRGEAASMIRSLKSYKIIKGTRGQVGVSEESFADVIVRLSVLLQIAPEIVELDFNPLLGTPESVTVVDARINIRRS
jgi:acetyltransferase